MNKRIVICSDGSWNSPEKGVATNVLKLARAICPIDSENKPQVVFYDWGVGTDGDTMTGGAFGAGLDKNIQDAYRFIVHNYQSGDELFLFGFSRGAYTVRSLAGFIRNVGIIKRKFSDQIPKAYSLYRSKSKPDSKRSIDYRKKYALADRATIDFIGVWDTVGTLGIPISFLGFLNNKYEFHDTKLSGIIKHARHAVSIDEKRKDFEPTLYKVEKYKVGNSNQNVKQVWFAGVHSDVGGGYKETDLSDIALKWMIEEAKALGLKVEPHLNPKGNAAGKIHRSYKGGFRFLGQYQRPLIKYGKIQLHPSVKTRYDKIKNYGAKNLEKYLAKYGW